MSFFKNLFGKKEPPAPSTSESIQKLRDTENMLLKKQEFLEQKVEQEHDLAKKNASTNKRGRSKIIFVTHLKSIFIFIAGFHNN